MDRYIKMSTLTSLPIGTLHHIIFFLPSDQYVAALSVHCRVLHSLCDMETREKYHGIDTRLSDNSVDQASNLLMDIMKRPGLGHYMHHVGYRERILDHEDYTAKGYQRKLSEDEMQTQ